MAACTTSAGPPKVITQVVEKPVPVACVPDNLPDAPSYPDSDAAIKAAPGPGEMLELMAAGRLQRQNRLEQLEPVVKACKAAAPAQPTGRGKLG